MDLAPEPTSPRPGLRFWTTRAGYGMGLAAVVALLEFAYYIPIVSDPDGLGPGAIASLLVLWGGEFVLLALAVALAEYYAHPHDLRPWQLALAVGAGAVTAVLIWHSFMYLVRTHFGLRLFLDHLGHPVVWQSMLLYHMWLMLFFGGLAAAVYSSRQRRARMLAALRAAELRRATSQQRLAEISLGSLRASVDPDYLFAALTSIERLYETDPTAADRLLDEVIAFLRKALAGMRDAPVAASAPPQDGAVAAGHAS